MFRSSGASAPSPTANEPQWLGAQALRIAQGAAYDYCHGRAGGGAARLFADPAFAGRLKDASLLGARACLDALLLSLPPTQDIAERRSLALAAAGLEEAAEEGGRFAERLAALGGKTADPAREAQGAAFALFAALPVAEAIKTDRGSFANDVMLRMFDAINQHRRAREKNPLQRSAAPPPSPAAPAPAPAAFAAPEAAAPAPSPPPAEPPKAEFAWPDPPKRKIAPTRPETPLVALRAISLDLETTGLDVRKDRIVQIGALRLFGEELDESSKVDLIVNPQIPIPPLATRIHGISDADARKGLTLAHIWPDLIAYLGDAPLIGHNVAFDAAILRNEAARLGLEWREPRLLDTNLLASPMRPGVMESSLDSVALWLGVEIEGRHRAYGDALATGRVYARMLPKLREAGVRTLAEAEAFQKTQSDLYDRQAKLGWFESADGSQGAGTLSPAGRAAGRAMDGFIHTTRLRDAMAAAAAVKPETSLRDAAKTMIESGVDCVLVEPLTISEAGILTERDVLRAFARRGAEIETLQVKDVMSHPLAALPEDLLVARALGLMARRNLRSVGVTDHSGAVVGLVRLRALMRDRAFSALALDDAIESAENATDLARAQAGASNLVASLLGQGLSARETASALSAEERALAARAAELAAARMEAEGRGPAPAPFCFVALGSSGRGETLLARDQDNALIIDESYLGDLDSPNDWFTLFAERVTETLDAAGVPYCKGGVMARNRPWRRNLSEWRAETDRWSLAPTPGGVTALDFLHDAAPIWGASGLAESLRAHALAGARRSEALARLYSDRLARFEAPVGGIMRRFRKESDGRVDLKAGGLLPIVSLARALAARRGVAAPDTPGRLKEALGKSHPAELRKLDRAHEAIMRLILEQQLEDMGAGVRLSSRVDVEKLAQERRDALRETLEGLGPLIIGLARTL